MTKAMHHRGPDGAGLFSSNGRDGSNGAVCLSMRRLSIIDLHGGWQPHQNEDESVLVVVNGEIYNYVELRDELRSRGHVFRTQSDCEVIVHLYEELGLEFVHKLRGMFAFALWDVKRRRLLLGRDRLGEKPLYIHEQNGTLWFASEMKSLLASGRIPFQLDAVALHAYMHYGWIPEPTTIVTGVKKLPPGHLLSVDIDSWSIKEHRYWRIEDAPPLRGNAVEILRAELDTIGKQIVRADVPIGVSLSGGIDSTLVAALAARHSTAPVRSYTIGYEGKPAQDERDLAAQTSKEIGIEHRTLEISGAEMIADFPKLAFTRDDPIADIAGYGYFKVSEGARADGCPVLLQGQGADELLWGYPWSIESVRRSMRASAGRPIGAIHSFWQQLPGQVSRPELVRFAYFLGGLLHGWRTLSPVGSTGGSMVVYELTNAYQIGRSASPKTYAREFIEKLGASIHHDGGDVLSSLRADVPVDIRTIAALCRGYLLQNGLAQGDRLSMANSVELRLPLVDYRLVEILVGLQKSTPMYNMRPKHVFREAARGLVPEAVFSRPKRPFSPPSAEWVKGLRKRYASELRNGLLVEERILSHESANRLARSQSRFGAGNDLFLKYLVLEYWYRGMRSFIQTAA